MTNLQPKSCSDYENPFHQLKCSTAYRAGYMWGGVMEEVVYSNGDNLFGIENIFLLGSACEFTISLLKIAILKVIHPIANLINHPNRQQENLIKAETKMYKTFVEDLLLGSFIKTVFSVYGPFDKPYDNLAGYYGREFAAYVMGDESLYSDHNIVA